MIFRLVPHLLAEMLSLLFRGSCAAVRLGAAALLTTLVEGAVFMTCRRFRKARFLAVCAAVNIASNLALNLAMMAIRPDSLLAWPVLVGEALAWTWEFLVYGGLFRFSWRLLLYTCLANAVTFGMSFLIAA